VQWFALERKMQIRLLQNVCSENEPDACWEALPTRSCFYRVGAFYDGTLLNTIGKVLCLRE